MRKEQTMKRIFSILLALALVLAFSVVMATPVAAQTTYYVATTGSDGNSGLSASPWLTIQHAVTSVTPGDIIMVAAGTYQEQVTITQSLNLIGAGEVTTTIQAPTSGRSTITVGTLPWDYAVAADGNGSPIDVKIQGFTIDANGQDATAAQNFAGVFFRDVGDGTGDGLYSSTIYNFGSYFGGWKGSPLNTWNGNTGVTIYGDSDLTIDDNDIDDYTVSGVSAIGSNVDVTVTGNDLDGTDSGYVGLFLRDGVGAISGNSIHGHTSTNAGFGIYLYQAAAATMIDDSAGPNTIDGNRVAVTLWDTDGATIDGNTISNSSYKSIMLQDDSDDNVVKSNTISPTASALAGVDIETNCGGNVIGGDTAADGNTITLPTSGSGNLYAIWLSGTDTGAVNVKHNTVNGGQRSVQFDGGPGHSGANTISDNTLAGAAFGGIMSYCFGDFVISGNTITGTDRPLEFWQAGNGDITITGNTISSTNFDAINAGSYSSMSISCNNLECLAGGWGVNNRMTTIIDARDNWWGDASGPSGGATDPSTFVTASGSGEVVGSSPYVRFDPWLGYAVTTARSTPTSTGGTAYFTPSQGGVSGLTDVPTPPSPPVTLPYGMFNFTICCIPSGGSTTLTITLPGPVPAGTRWYKYIGGSWYSLPIGGAGTSVITVTLQDGAFPDDEDSVPGQITDQGGPGHGAVGWETHPTDKVRVLVPWIALFAAFAAGVSLLVIRRRRTQT
jgi:parallel beta-helix repeat protein